MLTAVSRGNPSRLVGLQQALMRPVVQPARLHPQRPLRSDSQIPPGPRTLGGHHDALLRSWVPEHDLKHRLEATTRPAPAVGEYEEAMPDQPAKVPAIQPGWAPEQYPQEERTPRPSPGRSHKLTVDRRPATGRSAAQAASSSSSVASGSRTFELSRLRRQGEGIAAQEVDVPEASGESRARSVARTSRPSWRSRVTARSM